jgi:vesicle coat complex subunit
MVIRREFAAWLFMKTREYFADDDTYIRKAAYLTVGRIYTGNADLRDKIIKQLNNLFEDNNFKIRQTVVNAAGEIGRKNFTAVQHFFDTALFDPQRKCVR